MNMSESVQKTPAEWDKRRTDWNDASRMFVMLACLTLCILLISGIGLVLQNQWSKQPVLSMKGLAPSMSSQFFADMLRMEIPGLADNQSEAYTFSNGNVFGFLVQLFTNVNLKDTRTYIAAEIPGIREDIVPLKGQGIKHASPVDYAPSIGDLAAEPIAEPAIGDQDSLPDDASYEDITITEEPDILPSEVTSSPAALTTNGRKVVFIYHSHSRESWLPELKDKGITEAKNAEDADTNITLVGKRLASKLEERGVGAQHSNTDYPTAVKGYNWNFSYKYSHQTVVSAMTNNKDLTFFFDVHRDSQRRELTTTEINGKSYAQVYFIIGLRNENWEKNEAFATQMHDALEAQYPGLSRGIWGKGKKDGNGEYNQSLSSNSVVIEIGGPENTLEESYRTADVLADIVADMYWQAEKVNAGE
jgi:stage II sporulation protein P